MSAFLFYVQYIDIKYSLYQYKFEMRRKKTTPGQDSSGVHVWLVFMKAFQALMPHPAAERQADSIGRFLIPRTGSPTP